MLEYEKRGRRTELVPSLWILRTPSSSVRGTAGALEASASFIRLRKNASRRRGKRRSGTSRAPRMTVPRW